MLTGIFGCAQRANSGFPKGRGNLAWICLPLLALPGACRNSSEDFANPDPTEWPSYGRDYAEQRYSPLDKITRTNISELNLAWHYNFRVGRGVEGTPLMVNGVLYATSAWSIVYALDAKTGRELWVYDPKADPVQAARACCDVVNRGVAYADGRIFVGSIDGRLIALDAKTGKPLWDVQTVDKSRPYVISGAPRAAKGLVFIGNSGSDLTGGPDLGTRGYASAYDAKSGKLVWRFYTVPGDPAKPDGAASDSVMAMAAKTWTGKWWRYGGGGTVWDSITYDPELDRVYLGVGNGSPWNRQIRSPGGGDNLFLSSIIAVDRATGRYIWHYQTTPGDTWDSTATQSIVLANLKIGGKMRRVLMQAPKNGFYYVIDRDTGKLISAKNLVPMTKAAETPRGQPISWAYGVDLKSGRPLENKAARYENGTTAFVHPVGNGAHPWAPISFSPQTGLVYLIVQDPANRFKSDPNFVPRPYLRASGLMQTVGGLPPAATEGAGHAHQPIGTGAAATKDSAGALVAWNPVTQREVWRIPSPFSNNGGSLSTASNLLFQATSEPKLIAYDAVNGKKLWSYDIQAGAQGGAISYEIDGEQYIAIEAGNGGVSYMLAPPGIPDKPAPTTGRLLVFKVGGRDRLPDLPKTLPPFPSPPIMNADQQMIVRGGQLYAGYCTGCHGINAGSRRVVPDLRKTPVLQSKELFASVVRDGALASRGMPKLGAYVSEDQAEAIRAYLISVATAAYKKQAAQK